MRMTRHSIFILLGISQFELKKMDSNDINEAAAYQSTKRGILKSCLTRCEHDRLKIYSFASEPNKPSKFLSEIDLNHVVAYYNQSINAITLKSCWNTPSLIQKSSQCTLIVSDVTSDKEFVWIFPNQLERSIWIRELLQRQYVYHQLIYPNFLLLTRINVQEGINADKQQMMLIVYDERAVICSETVFDEIDLRKYSSLSK
jgi:hypothetical protein